MPQTVWDGSMAVRGQMRQLVLHLGPGALRLNLRSCLERTWDYLCSMETDIAAASSS